MAVEYCPRCRAERVGSFRFCRSCGFDFEDASAAAVAPAGLATSTSSTSPDMLVAAGVAWIVCAALTGYLALEQLNASQTLTRLGLASGELGTDAIWNGFSAIVTVYFGARLVMKHQGLLVWSMIWAAISVAGGAYQIANGVSEATFVLSTVAAGTAGILSFAGWNATRDVALSTPTLYVAPMVAAASPVVYAPTPPDPVGIEPAIADSSPGTGPNMILIVAGLVLAAAVLAIGFVLVSRAPGGSPAPSHPVAAAPTPTLVARIPTEPPVAPVLFGTTVDKTTRDALNPSTTFKSGKTIYWDTQVGFLPPGQATLVVSETAGTGFQKDTPFTSSGNDPNLTGQLTGLAPGQYSVQIRAGLYVYAEGSFTVR